MHHRILAQKSAIATDRMVELAPKVAEKFGVEETVSTAYDRQPDIKQMLRNEAVADLLQALADVELAQDSDTEALLDRIEAIDGIGPKTVELIRKELE